VPLADLGESARDERAPTGQGQQSGLDEAAGLTGFDEVVRTLPDGWDTFVGLGGVGLSVGERQRLSLTAALLSGAERPLVILDEPTAHLDAATEETVIATVRALRDQGKTVVVIAHRQALLNIADGIIDIHASTAAGEVAIGIGVSP
jgi:ATP-binding cassette subfamily C protein CydD